MLGTHPRSLRGCTGCELGVLPRKTGYHGKGRSVGPSLHTAICTQITSSWKPPSGLSHACPGKETRQCLARGCWRGRVRQPAPGIDVPWGKRHLQSGWQSLSQPCSWGHLGDRHQMPLPCLPTPFQADRALHNQPCPALRNPRSFHPSQRSHPPGVAEPDPAAGTAPGRTGQGSGHGTNARGHVLPAQPWLGPRGAALAALGGSAAGRVAPGLGCCGSRIPASLTQVLPAPLSRHRSPARLQLRPFLPGVANSSGWLRTYPGQHPAGARDGPEYPALPWEGRDHTDRAISKQFGHLQTGL